MAWGHFDERELDLDGGRPLRVCLWPPGLSCSGECWPRRQKVISCRSATGVIHHQCQRLLISQVSIGTGAAANQWGHFILLEHLLFDARYWLVGLIPVLWGFICSVLWKGVGREWWTLWCWQPAELLTDVRGICARILLCSPFTAKNPQISLRGLIQICTLILVHIIPSQRYEDQKAFLLKKFPWITSSVPAAEVHV